MFGLLFFLIGCGGGDGKDYDKYEDGTTDADTSDQGKTDTDRTDNDTTDADITDSGITGDDDETGDNTNNDSDTENTNDEDPGDTVDFWSTCEGIIVCIKGCVTNDNDCINACYSSGTSDEQISYRRWAECFNENCSENRTKECSAEQCAEWDEKCNASEAIDWTYDIPAPYGNATFAGEFSYILDNSLPSADNEAVINNFASGNISSMSLTPEGTIVSFARMFNDKKKGKLLEVYQFPYNLASQTSGNPAVILRIKADVASQGLRNIGLSDQNDAELIVADITIVNNQKIKIQCYHALGIGTFNIDEAVINPGSSSKFKLSEGTAELFHLRNIPELGGDARETLGLPACSLIN